MMAECAACGGRVDLERSVQLRKDGFDIVRCPNCGLLFRGRMPTDAELEEIYGAAYFSSAAGDTRGQGYVDYLAEEDLHRETARRRLDGLERYAQRGTLLDVGAAAGFFVAEARDRGWDARGLDIAPDMVAASCGAVELGTIDDAEGRFDVVTMWDAIEHLRDPLADVRRAAALLRPHGILGLSTGDAGSVVARLSGSRWHLLTPRHHTFFFSVPTLTRLLDRGGFELVSVSHPGARYSLRYLAHKLRTLSDGAPTRAVAATLDRSPFGQVRIPVNLGDIVTVLARRRTA
jgi:SAM-dependent methyltransferase